MVTTVRSTGPEHPLRISVLGPVRAWAGTEELKLGAPQRKAVLAVLAMRVGEVVTKSELIDAVWGETPPTCANGSLYTYISALRGALEPGRSNRSPGRVLESDSVGYRLSLRGEFAVDAIQFDALCARVKRCLIDGATADALDALDAALALWHGDALTGIPGPFADAQRGRLTDLRLTMVERRARLLINAGRHHEVVHDLDRWSNDHPSREGLLSLLMHAQHIAGRSAAALEAFDRFCASSGARLGAEPGPALTELAERIRLDDPRLGMTVDDPAGLTRPIPLVAWSRPRRSRHFVGRGAELSAIRAAVTAVSAGVGASLWIEGEPGIGKSALVLESLVGTGDCQIAWGTADELARNVPLRTIFDCLDITTVSPDPRRVAIATSAHRADGRGGAAVDAVAEQVVRLVRTLCASAPLILIADELQWADAATLAVWRALARDVRAHPLLLITECRRVPRRSDVADLRAALVGAGTQVLVPAPLPDTEVRELVHTVVGATPTAAQLEHSRFAAGNPLYVRTIAESAAGSPDEISAAAHPVVSRHLAHLSEQTRTTLRWAAQLGRRFGAAELATALDHPAPELSANLDEAVYAGVLTEIGGRLLFRHELVRLALRHSMPSPVRSWMSRRAAGHHA